MSDQDLIRNSCLTRSYLKHYETEKLGRSEFQILKLSDMVPIKINRISREREVLGKSYLEIRNSLIGLCQEDCKIGLLIQGDYQGLSIYLLAEESLIDNVTGQFSSTFMDFETEKDVEYTICENYSYHGLAVGLPRVLDEKSVLALYPICQAMLGKKYSILVVATAKSTWETQIVLKNIREEIAKANETASSSVTTGDRNFQIEDTISKKYKENLEAYDNLMSKSLTCGRWETQIRLSTEKEKDFTLLSQLVKSAYSDSEKAIEGVSLIPLELPSNAMLLSELFWRDVQAIEHPFNSYDYPSLYQFSSHTILNSDQLATLFQFPEKELPGFAIDESVLFESSNRRGKLKTPFLVGKVKNQGCQIEQDYSLELDDLTRHILLIGMTGSGKTNTSKTLLTTLWNKHKIPFLVIESAKREYWEMANLIEQQGDALNLFTLGEESLERGVPYRLNPFEVIGKTSIQSHIDRLFATFKASFELVAPTPFILEQALYAIYDDYGWDIITNQNRSSREIYPTLTDLVHKIDDIVEESGYSGEIESNIKASLRARVNSLRLGGKGMMLDVEKSFPIEELLNQPTILELEDLGDDETKSFVIGLLLTQLYEYRQTYQAGFGSSALNHLLVIEEAHRLLKKEEEGNSSKAKAIEFFTNLLAEIRSFGQGIFIADQIPTKLASDTIKNTNLKIVHRTVAKEDRDGIGDAMNMTDPQKSFLSYLRRGVAAVYAEGDYQPKLVQFPRVKQLSDYQREHILYNTYVRMKPFYHSVEPLPFEYRLKTDSTLFDKQSVRELFKSYSMEDIRLGCLVDVFKIPEEDYDLQYRCLTYLLENSRLTMMEQKDILSKYRREICYGRF